MGSKFVYHAEIVLLDDGISASRWEKCERLSGDDC